MIAEFHIVGIAGGATTTIAIATTTIATTTIAIAIAIIGGAHPIGRNRGMWRDHDDRVDVVGHHHPCVNRYAPWGCAALARVAKGYPLLLGDLPKRWGVEQA